MNLVDENEVIQCQSNFVITRKELDNITLREAMSRISNAVYDTGALLELLEGKKTFGNGHHMQKD